jgi:arylsulfatase A-like enzyme
MSPNLSVIAAVLKLFRPRLDALLFVLFCFPCFNSFSAPATNSRPNILFCLADDWSWPHAGAYGDKTIRTPTFDRVAREGMLFNFCFSAAPSCTPSRAAMLTGQYPHRLEQGSCLWGYLPKRFAVYPDLLEKSGYTVGFTGKGWGPGDFKAGGFTRNPAGPNFKSFSAFLSAVPDGKPFCFWFGSHHPHRPYEKGFGARAGLKTDGVKIPAYWPDNETSRNDVLDYYASAERYDQDTGEALELLRKAGKLEHTIVVMSGDNGWPFPRCKANLYDGGTRQPLALRWPEMIKAGQVSDDFINLMDLAPTFLEAGGLRIPSDMTGRSFLKLLTGQEKSGSRNIVYLERERHANVREGGIGYPVRAVRTRDFLYIKNFRPTRWPAGDPQPYADPKQPFGDCDAGPTKTWILDHRAEVSESFSLCFEKRPAEELYDVKTDPDEVRNLAESPALQSTKRKLQSLLQTWMRETADPRATSDDDHWDSFPYFGGKSPLAGVKQ